MAQVERGAGVLGSPRGDVFLSLPTLPCGSASGRTQPMGSPSKRVWSGRRGGAGEGLRLSRMTRAQCLALWAALRQMVSSSSRL